MKNAVVVRRESAFAVPNPAADQQTTDGQYKPGLGQETGRRERLIQGRVWDVARRGMKSTIVTPDRAARLLRYQKNRTLDRCGGFLASMQIETGGGNRFFMGLRADGLELHTDADRQYVFDLEGRPVRFNTPTEYRFRGISHRGTVMRRPEGMAAGGYERRLLSRGELIESCQEAWRAAEEARGGLNGPGMVQHAFPDSNIAVDRLLPVLERISRHPPQELEREAGLFREVYQPVPVLPPDHYGSLVLQATEGCSFNTCAFCKLYRGIPFRVRAVERFERHLLDALAFHGEGLRRFTRIFLGQANALAMPQARLISILECIGRRVELPPPEEPAPRPVWAHGHRLRFLGIGSFLDGFTGLAKSAADYAELRRLGLSRVCLGVESGSPELLRWLRKPANPEEMRETLRRLKEAGLATDIVLLAGAGGSAFAAGHVRDSLEFVKNSPLTQGDRVYLSPIREYPGSDYARLMDEGRIRRLTPAQIQQQTLQLAKGIRARGPQAVPYRLEPFVY